MTKIAVPPAIGDIVTWGRLTNSNENFASQWCIESAKNGERLMIVMASW